MRKYRSNAKNYSLKNARFFALCAMICAALIFCSSLNKKVGPIVFDLAKNYGSSAVLDVINDAVSSYFDSEDIGYSDLVRLSYNSAGFVTSAEFDSQKINEMKTDCLKVLSKSLSRLKTAKLKVPVGSLFGDVSLSGRGPSIKLRVSGSAVPDIEILSVFDSIGMNQSRHEIIMRVSAKVSLYLPPKSDEFTVTQDYVLAQTLIVGEVPSGCAFIE